MRRDLKLLLRPLEQAKHKRRRAALRSRFACAALATLIATVALIVHEGAQPGAAAALLVFGLAIIGYQVGQLARMPDPVPAQWLHLAIDRRLSAAGRGALTGILPGSNVSCDTAFDWARTEFDRPLDADRLRIAARDRVGR